MAYQNVGTPRFFIDNYMYLRAIGLDPQAYIDITSEINNLNNTEFQTPLDNENAFTLSPEMSKQFISNVGAMRVFIPCGDMVRGMDFSGNMKWYGALLNHNLDDCDCRIQNIMFMGAIDYETNVYSEVDEENKVSVLNIESHSEIKNGSSIWYSDLVPSPPSDSSVRFTGLRLTDDGTGNGNLSNFQVGAISMGVMYTMPNSSDLNLTMQVEFGGYDETETLGGSTLTNIRQTGAPIWSNDGEYNSPFSVGDFSDNQYLGGAKRNGRRSWSLKFSYISDENIFSSNYMANNYTETTTDYSSDDLDTDNQFEYNMFTDDSFMAQVWNKTLGGALPFIFQPDSNNDNPDQFCIAKFDMDTLSVKQVAFKTYSISVKIREVW